MGGQYLYITLAALPPKGVSVTIVKENGWTAAPVWKGVENIAPIET
jgi:hypothetical protein